MNETERVAEFISAEFISVSIGSSSDRELQVMQALTDVMEWFDSERRMSDAPQDQETTRRIGQWFANRYGGAE